MGCGCKGFFECLLKLLNFLLTLVGLAMVGYGIYLFVEYQKTSSGDDSDLSPSSGELIQLGRPMLMAVSIGSNFLDKLPKAWYEKPVKLILFLCIAIYGC